MGVAVGVSVGVCVGIGVAVEVWVGVRVGISVGYGVGVEVSVGVGVNSTLAERSEMNLGVTIFSSVSGVGVGISTVRVIGIGMGVYVGEGSGEPHATPAATTVATIETRVDWYNLLPRPLNKPLPGLAIPSKVPAYLVAIDFINPMYGIFIVQPLFYYW